MSFGAGSSRARGRAGGQELVAALDEMIQDEQRRRRGVEAEVADQLGAEREQLGGAGEQGGLGGEERAVLGQVEVVWGVEGGVAVALAREPDAR
jgi:hypothetical protein